jgi:putative ABC transport system ATP-binding protein
MIRVDHVTKMYGNGGKAFAALDDVSLTVQRGEFLSIMGPSGSGKTTLLHLLGGLDAPTRGEIWVDERPLSTMTDDEITVFRRRHVGYVFQSFNLLPTLSAEENVALQLLLDGEPRRVVGPRVTRVLELAGLAHRRHHRPDALSGGEQQRVAIARALVNDPLVVLADEPTGNLDSRTGERMLEWLKSTAETTGQTVVMVTHDPHAASYGDRTVTLRDGRVADDVPEKRWRARVLPLVF